MTKYYAELNEDGYVLNIIFADENAIFPNNFIEYSLTGEFRKNPANIGCKYDKDNDAFIEIQPYPSWTFNEETFKWEAPVAKPEGPAAWDEINQRWNTPE